MGNWCEVLRSAPVQENTSLLTLEALLFQSEGATTDSLSLYPMHYCTHGASTVPVSCCCVKYHSKQQLSGASYFHQIYLSEVASFHKNTLLLPHYSLNS